MGLVEKKKLDHSGHIITGIPDRRWKLDIIRPYSDGTKNTALPISRSTDKFAGDGKGPADNYHQYHHVASSTTNSLIS